MNIDLTGKKAIVCGSTQGIGRASARELATMGAAVVLVARNEDALKSEMANLPTAGQKHDYLVADFSNPEQVRERVEAYVKANGPINILVNNTGGPPGGPITSAKTTEFLSTFTQHLICNQILAQAVLEGMKSSGYGRIINIISTSVKLPLKGLGVSNTVRAAVGNWAKTWANEVGQFGITVNNVLPGATATSRLQSILEAKAQKTGQTIEQVKKEMTEEIPMQRFASPEEVAQAVAFLASPAASYITGINVPVDGGRTGNL
ncbi:MAG: SDR family oxidoreductase [Bacteroidetes bacterium]|nr:SDR family oxidoreductase [Bacteroidota bacterium]